MKWLGFSFVAILLIVSVSGVPKFILPMEPMDEITERPQCGTVLCTMELNEVCGKLNGKIKKFSNPCLMYTTNLCQPKNKRELENV